MASGTLSYNTASIGMRVTGHTPGRYPKAFTGEIVDFTENKRAVIDRSDGSRVTIWPSALTQISVANEQPAAA